MTLTEKFNNTPSKKPIILIAPLDWGLGHATRCIPLIKHFDLIGCEVIIATCGIQKSLLEAEFPNLQFTNLAGYGITFSTKRVKTIIKILWQIPRILKKIEHEKSWLKVLLQKNSIDLVISDNRFGLFNKNVPSIFITHQLTIKTPFGRTFENLLRKINYHYINKFTECWIPDFAGSNNMGGELSHPFKMPSVPVKFLGRLSRIIIEESPEKRIQLMVILSGPEPQRTCFENILLPQLYMYGEPAILVRGLPGVEEPLTSTQKNLAIYNHLPAQTLNQYINAATIIISRSGYSTVMDLVGLNKKCIFIPTPGQSEQEYLAGYLSSRKYCLSYEQSKFHLDQAVREAQSFQFLPFKEPGKDLYKKIISDFLTVRL